MKHILTLIIMTFLITSCGTKKEMVVESESVVEEAAPKTQPEPRKRRVKKPRVDADKLIAQLGLSEEQEKEFLAMWSKTSDDFLNAREDNMGNKKEMIAKMTAAKNEREAGLERILTDAQMIKYYEIMDENRKTMGGDPIKDRG